MREQVGTIFAETGTEPGSVPVVAVTDWPDRYPKFGPYLRDLAVRWRELEPGGPALINPVLDAAAGLGYRRAPD
jgi:hypothetical protein